MHHILNNDKILEIQSASLNCAGAFPTNMFLSPVNVVRSGQVPFFFFFYKDMFVKHPQTKTKTTFILIQCQIQSHQHWNVFLHQLKCHKRLNGCSVLAGFSATQGAAPNRDPQLRLSEGILMHTHKVFHTYFTFLKMSTIFSNAQVGYFLWMCELSDSFALGK